MPNGTTCKPTLERNGRYVLISNLSTHAEGFGFNVGWGPARGVGVNIGLMYRERGAFAGANAVFGFNAGLGAHGQFGLNYIINMNHGNTMGIFASFGGADKNMSAGASAGLVCIGNTCEDVYSGYSAVDYGAMGIGPYNTRDEYPTSDRKGSGGRHQKIGLGADGEEMTFSFDKDGFFGGLFGERGGLGLAGQLAGLKPTSVMHDNLVVSRSTLERGIPGKIEFFATMPASFVVAQPLAHYSERVRGGYNRFARGL